MIEKNRHERLNFLNKDTEKDYEERGRSRMCVNLELKGLDSGKSFRSSGGMQKSQDILIFTSRSKLQTILK